MVVAADILLYATILFMPGYADHEFSAFFWQRAGGEVRKGR